MYDFCMLDKSLEYVEIVMKRKAGRPVCKYPLPEGYCFVPFRPGDDEAWADIEASVGEFDSREKALKFFRNKYSVCRNETERRCIFIIDQRGNKVATFTAWWEYIGKKRFPWVSWVAVMPGHQGKGLGKALVSEGLRLFREIEGDVDLYLKTQTWSYKAVNIYIEQGFRMQRMISRADGDTFEVSRARKILKGYLR